MKWIDHILDKIILEWEWIPRLEKWWIEKTWDTRTIVYSKDFNYSEAVKKFKNLSNSDLKRLFKQNGVKLNSKKIDLSFSIKDLSYGDEIIFGSKTNFLNCIVLEVFNTTILAREENKTLYQWLIENEIALKT